MPAVTCAGGTSELSDSTAASTSLSYWMPDESSLAWVRDVRDPVSIISMEVAPMLSDSTRPLASAGLSDHSARLLSSAGFSLLVSGLNPHVFVAAAASMSSRVDSSVP
jgi:hypothetical protein